MTIYKNDTEIGTVDTNTVLNYGVSLQSIDDVELNSGDTIKIVGKSWGTSLDYVLLEKNSDLTAETDPSYGELKTAYKGTVGDNVEAVAKYFTVNTGSGTKSKINVDVEGKSDTKALSQITNSNVVFGILLESTSKTAEELDGYTIGISFE